MAQLNPATHPQRWWKNLIDLHPPKNSIVAKTMDDVRAEFRDLGSLLITELPPGPDLTVALRSLKQASMDAIAAIACNQDHYPDMGEDDAFPYRETGIEVDRD